MCREEGGVQPIDTTFQSTRVQLQAGDPPALSKHRLTGLLIVFSTLVNNRCQNKERRHSHLTMDGQVLSPCNNEIFFIVVTYILSNNGCFSDSWTSSATIFNTCRLIVELWLHARHHLRQTCLALQQGYPHHHQHYGETISCSLLTEVHRQDVGGIG